jgi:hypothetical protein
VIPPPRRAKLVTNIGDEQMFEDIRHETRQGRRPRLTRLPDGLLAYREGLDRATRTRDPRELSDMLARAEIPGDAPLAEAVQWRGYEL